MDAKLNQSDLISLLAKESNISIAKSEQFTKNFFDLIIEGLEQDGIVKINGLGTFKITDVASRGSVNVNTGEKIEIKGHKKLTFLPADALKDSVNQPFAMFEPVEVDDSYQPDSANEVEADDTVESAEVDNGTDETVENISIPAIDIDTKAVAETTGEEGALSQDDEINKNEKEEPAAQVTEEECGETTEAAEPVTTAGEDIDFVQQPKAEPIVVQERPNEPVMVHVPKKRTTNEDKQSVAPVKKKSKWRIAVCVIMGFVTGVIAVNMMSRNSAADIEKGSLEPDRTILQTALVEKENRTEILENEQQPEAISTDSAIIENIAPSAESVNNAAEIEKPVESVSQADENPTTDIYEFVMVDELAAINLKDITLADTLLYISDGELARHTVAPDETLTRIAKRYFGDKKLWPYIVKYNNIGKPDDLCSGMEIAIPRLKPSK